MVVSFILICTSLLSYVMYFSINMCGMVSISGLHGELSNIFISYSAFMVFESYVILFFFSFCHSYLDLSHDFHAQLCFHSHFIFTAHTSLGCRNVS